MRVAVLTTSYPRWDGDGAGAFVAELVEVARAAGVEVTVVSPASFQHFGLAYGDGIVGNVRAAPWKALLLPAFMVSFALAARRAARGVELVHAHWLPSGLVGLATGKPLVVQPWGTDVEVGPWLARFLLPRARVVVAASEFLAGAARRLGAREVHIVPVPVRVPEHVGDPHDPPHVLYVGRLSEEKGILDFLEATEGIPRAIVGDGPLRDRVPESVGRVSRERLGEYYERAAVVCVPSRREGYGMVAREAMAYGRPVVATAVGGLVDAVQQGETGLLVPGGRPDVLRDVLERLLADAILRGRLGEQARRVAARDFLTEHASRALLGAYRAALGRGV
jgi:glycosyltransferase involved in cell wall biosynthesis